MAFLERLGRKLSDSGSRGQYDTVDESEDLVSKEGLDISSLRQQHADLLASHRKLKIWLWSVCSVLGFALIALLSSTFRGSLSPTVKHKIPTPVPDMPTSLVKFEQNDTFAGPSNQHNDEAWTAMMPAGDGFIVVPSADKYDLAPGKSSKHGDVYDISMFHQLHCLAHIRNHYYLTQEALHSNNSVAIEEKLLGPQEDHVHHCFDYIRQGIMCAADMTLEWPRTEENGDRFAVDGWGVTHECKDWDAIVKFMEDNDVASRIWSA